MEEIDPREPFGSDPDYDDDSPDFDDDPAFDDRKEEL